MSEDDAPDAVGLAGSGGERFEDARFVNGSIEPPRIRFDSSERSAGDSHHRVCGHAFMPASSTNGGDGVGHAAVRRLAVLVTRMPNIVRIFLRVAMPGCSDANWFLQRHRA